MNDTRPIIGITMGDAAGIGPEIIAKCLLEREVYATCRPLVIGDEGIMMRVLEWMENPPVIRTVTGPDEGMYQIGTIDLVDLENLDVTRITPGILSEDAGGAAVEYVKKAVDLALAGRINATVSAPLNKEAMNRAGFRYQGHTELIGDLCGSVQTGLVLISGSVHLVYGTGHVPLRDACTMVTRGLVLERINFIYNALMELGFKHPRIAVCALNPHAGDGGFLGNEEIDHIIPAIESAQRECINAIGPITVETVWLRAKKGEFDGVLSMTHDHGNIGIKLLDSGPVITYQAGLPIIRTSVAHGTAFDIAGTLKADHSVLRAAILFAAHLVQREKHVDGKGGNKGIC